MSSSFTAIDNLEDLDVTTNDFIPFSFSDREALTALIQRANEAEKTHVGVEDPQYGFSPSPLEKLQHELHLAISRAQVLLNAKIVPPAPVPETEEEASRREACTEEPGFESFPFSDFGSLKGQEHRYHEES